MIIGSIDIEVDATDDLSGIDRVEFYINDELKATDTTKPFNWTWDERTPFKFRYTIMVTAYDIAGNSAMNEIMVWRFL